ncbi:MAG: HGGxSTG domain-containing protein [Beijerinckiaceae bacterium]
MDAANSEIKTCGARTRSGAPCKRAPVPGRARCHYHGGAPDSGGPRGARNGAYKHGERTKEAVTERRWAKNLVTTLAKGC